MIKMALERDWEPPFLLTVVVGFGLLLVVVAAIQEFTVNPWDVQQSLAAEGCEFVDGTLYAPDGKPSVAALSAARRLARQVGLRDVQVKASPER
jgi:hypothetical protein